MSILATVLEVLHYTTGLTGLVASQLMLLATLADFCGYRRISFGSSDAEVSTVSFDLICATVLAATGYVATSALLVVAGA